jgi:hypothetical protein
VNVCVTAINIGYEVSFSWPFHRPPPPRRTASDVSRRSYTYPNDHRLLLLSPCPIDSQDVSATQNVDIAPATPGDTLSSLFFPFSISYS